MNVTEIFNTFSFSACRITTYKATIYQKITGILEFLLDYNKASGES